MHLVRGTFFFSPSLVDMRDGGVRGVGWENLLKRLISCGYLLILRAQFAGRQVCRMILVCHDSARGSSLCNAMAAIVYSCGDEKMIWTEITG
jgi:hypothetical protein